MRDGRNRKKLKFLTSCTFCQFSVKLSSFWYNLVYCSLACSITNNMRQCANQILKIKWTAFMNSIVTDRIFFCDGWNCFVHSTMKVIGEWNKNHWWLLCASTHSMDKLFVKIFKSNSAKLRTELGLGWPVTDGIYPSWRTEISTSLIYNLPKVILVKIG